MAYDITLEGKNLERAETLLEDAIQIFDQCKIAYWLEGGTLLGIRREQRLLPWDDDLDISMMQKELGKLNPLLSSLKKAGFRIRIRTFDEDSAYFKKGDIRMIKIRTKRFFGLLKGQVCLDVFVKYPHEQKAYWEIANKTKFVPVKFYESLKTITFKGYSYQVPLQTDEYLSYRYGDWQTPVKDWDTTKDDKALN